MILFCTRKSLIFCFILNFPKSNDPDLKHYMFDIWEQDIDAKAETTQDHAEWESSSESLNKAKNKVKDAPT
jgi:hypothetical protein